MWRYVSCLLGKASGPSYQYEFLQEAMAIGQAMYASQQPAGDGSQGPGPSDPGSPAPDGDNVVDAEFTDTPPEQK